MGQVAFGLCCGGIGAQIGEVTDKAAKETAKFTGKVVAYYIKGMILLKIEDVVEEITSSVDINEEEPDEDEEQKQLEDVDTDSPVIASGVFLTGYKNATGKIKKKKKKKLLYMKKKLFFFSPHYQSITFCIFFFL